MQKKPIIQLLYTPWDLQSLKRGVTFNKIYKDFKEEGNLDKICWASLDGDIAFTRYKMTLADLGSCHRAENLEFFKKHPTADYESDIPISMKIDHNFPALIGYFNKNVLGIVDGKIYNEGKVMTKFNPIIDQIKSKY